MKNSPKAYFIDIDRTLIHPSDETLHIDDVQAIKKCSKEKIYIILSTGRSIDKALPVWEQFADGTKYTGYAIINNGSAIWDLNKKQILFEDQMNEKDFNAISKFVEENKYAMKNSLENKFYTKNKLLKFIIKNIKGIEVTENFNENIFNKDTAKKIGIISSTRNSKVRKVKNEIVQKFNGIDVVVSGRGHFIEVNKKNINKGFGAIFLSKKLGFDVKDAIHIGDSMNDLSSGEVCSLLVTPKNAMKELKNIADYYTDKAKNAGVSKAINYFSWKK